MLVVSLSSSSSLAIWWCETVTIHRLRISERLKSPALILLRNFSSVKWAKWRLDHCASQDRAIIVTKKAWEAAWLCGGNPWSDHKSPGPESLGLILHEIVLFSPNSPLAIWVPYWIGPIEEICFPFGFYTIFMRIIRLPKILQYCSKLPLYILSFHKAWSGHTDVC